MTIKHHIKVEDGKPIFENRHLFDNELRSYEGKKAFLTISQHRNARSMNQNRYYWGVVLAILAKETGNDKDDLHSFFKSYFLGEKKVRVGNYEQTTSNSSTELDTKRFEDYMTDIRTFASRELGIVVPEPNEVL